MKIRTTETEHPFEEKLYRKIKAFSLGGLLMNKDRDFTAAVEYVECEDSDNFLEDQKIPFTGEQVISRMILASSLNVPFFIIVKDKEIFRRFEPFFDDNNQACRYAKGKEMSEREFIEWWGNLKGTVQTHPLFEDGEERARNTTIDQTLRRYGLEWGGNIDGYIVNNGVITAIIDNIFIGEASQPMGSRKADPARYFHKRGPKYETWLSTVKLANQLQVPHLLFTLDRVHNNLEVIGLTAIDYLSHDGINYRGNVRPYENLIYGLDEIEVKIKDIISKSSPPEIV